MTSPRTYAVFGLIMRSDLVLDVLDEVEAPDSAIDVRIVRTKGITRQGVLPVDPYFAVEPDIQYLYWRAIGTFLITRPDEVLVEPKDGVSDHLASQALLGLVMSLVLERRELLCLHASAVNVHGSAVVFLGDKGAGKSTTSGALLARGHLPVSDDLVPVVGSLEPTDPLVIQPGFSCMKLYPDSVAALGLTVQDTDRHIHPSTDKIQKRMPMQIPKEPVPLGAVFVLKRSAHANEVQADRLQPHEALQMIMRYTFMARYGETRLGRDHLARHLKRCGGVVARVPVYDLWIPEDLTRLNSLSDRIVETLKTAAT